MKPYKFEVFKGTFKAASDGSITTTTPDPQFYWRCRAPNGRIVADGGEGYKTRSGCVRALNKLRAMMPGVVG